MVHNLMLAGMLTAALLVMFGLKKGTFKRFLLGPPPLLLRDLVTVFTDEISIERETDHPLAEGTDHCFRIVDVETSVFYARTRRADGVMAETVDVCQPGKAGFIATLEDGVIVKFTRVGGATESRPEFGSDDGIAFRNFLIRVKTAVGKMAIASREAGVAWQ